MQVEAVGSTTRQPLRDHGKWASQELTHKVHTFFKLTHYPDLTPEQKENWLLRGSDLHGGFQHVINTQPPIGHRPARGGCRSGDRGLWRRCSRGGQGVDRRQPFSRNRSGETSGCGLDGLCARETLLAWPAVVAWAVWLFRDELVRLLPRMRFKYKDAEIDFRLMQAERDAQAVPPRPIEEASKPTPEEENRFERLAHVSPRAAIVEMRAELEQAMAGFAERHGVIDPSPRKMLSILNMTRLFRAREFISPEVSALLDDIRTIGNAAAHGDSDKISFEDAQRFRKLWELAMAQFSSY